MIYIGQDDATIIALAIFLIICIGLFILGIILLVKKDSDLGAAFCVSGIILGLAFLGLLIDRSRCYKIKIVDKNVTVDELTNKFIIRHYDVRNDIWYVCEKDGGYSIKELNNDNNRKGKIYEED